MKYKTKKRRPTLIVVTGGPGAGKTAVLELARKTFCEHIDILPEAATVVFSGGFRREKSVAAQQAAQRAIFHIQREMERLVLEENRADVVLCDRGSLDGLAYWPGNESSFLRQLKTSREKELKRYSMVIHLRTPTAENGYNYANPYRIETPSEAAALDDKTLKAWKKHPRHFVINGTEFFLEKAEAAIALIRAQLPKCDHHDG